MSKERWQTIQENEYVKGQARFQETGSYFGFFSVPEFEPTSEIARRLLWIDGPILDIGCGLLPMPNYLKCCYKSSYGIDPYLGQPREFPFAQSIGEALPFRSGFFGGCLLMSSLDHAIDPQVVINEAWRVLRATGLLFVWYTPRARPDKSHEWAFNHQDIVRLASGFLELNFIVYSGNRSIGYPKTEMVVLKKD